MHIHPSSPNSSEENAAVKIQAGFRGYRVRKQLSKPKSHRRHSRKMSAPSTDVSVKSVDSNSTTMEDKSATKIQAGVRGFLARKKYKVANEAATKIQAGFRGFKVRKELKQQD
ncbi:hypothetical protein ACFFRR_005986 [Megaselia abdita]